MAGVSFSGVELRKLPPSFKLRLGQLLDIDDSWRKLMIGIPSLPNVPSSLPKYTMEHVGLIEKAGQKSSIPCGEILLDEWGSSGQVRPTVETLLQMLIKCGIYRAADYVATEILGIDPPTRPSTGPAAAVVVSSVFPTEKSGAAAVEGMEEALERLNNHDCSTGPLIPFHIALIRTKTEDFDKDFCIGSGAFGSVYKVDLSAEGGPILAVKVLTPSSSIVEDTFLTEIRVLSEYKHENLVPLLGYCTNGPQYCLVYDYMKNGSLLEALTKGTLDWRRRVEILFGVGKGLNYLHSAKEKPLIHRDIKSANVLLGNNFIPKIGDFGLAKSINPSQTSALTSTIFGTSAYMAPEAFRGDISPKMDVFSFGVIILEVLTGLPPFDQDREGNDIVTYLEEAVEEDGDISPFIDPFIAPSVDLVEAQTLFDLSQRCVQEKKKRPNSGEVLVQLKKLNALKT